jgi:hypothetical protein
MTAARQMAESNRISHLFGRTDAILQAESPSAAQRVGGHRAAAGMHAKVGSAGAGGYRGRTRREMCEHRRRQQRQKREHSKRTDDVDEGKSCRRSNRICAYHGDQLSNGIATRYAG